MAKEPLVGKNLLWLAVINFTQLEYNFEMDLQTWASMI